MKNKIFWFFWAGQTVSLLGSAMTGYALSLWAYAQTGKAFTVSLLTLCACLPYTLLAPLAGALADRLPKKTLLLWPDAVSAAATACALLLLRAGGLRVPHLYVLNTVLGCMGALQSPAAAAAFGLLVPQGEIARAMGVRSFGDAATTLLAPVLAAAVLSLAGLPWVLGCDLAAFALAFPCVLFLVRLPAGPRAGKKPLRADLHEGARWLRGCPGMRVLVVGIALINLFSRLTYENVLTPMLVARSGSGAVAGAVNSMLGLAGLLGGLFVAADRKRRDPVRMVWGWCALSFLTGDLLMGLGRSLPVWLIAGFCASFPIPLIVAGQNVLFYGAVPRELQGRVYAVKTALQQATVPVGLLLGGALADRVFEPLMASGNALARLLAPLVGTGRGSGMAAMFLCTALLGSACSLRFLRSPALRALAEQVRRNT